MVDKKSEGRETILLILLVLFIPVVGIIFLVDLGFRGKDNSCNSICQSRGNSSSAVWNGNCYCDGEQIGCDD